jgi:DNA-binding CsgD family transcriptional regulator
LSVPDVGAFLAAVYGRMPSYRVIEAVHARTGGNPFFLEEMLAAAREDDPDRLTTQALPWSLGELVRSQLSDLTAEQRQVVEAAAVLGRRVSFDILAVVSGYSEDELIPILRLLVARGLLVEAEADVFMFRHALAREAIESDLLGRERRRLHEAALAALHQADSDDAAAIAYHAHGAGRFDEMVAAARLGARQALQSGSTYQALQLAELGLSEACKDPELLKLASRAAWLAGILPDALVHAQRRLDIARQTGDPAAQSAALRLVCRLHRDLGDSEGTARATDELIALTERLEDGPERGKAMASLAQMRMLVEDVEGTAMWADRAIDLADRLGLPEVRVRAEIEKGSAFANSASRADAGVALLCRAIDEAAAAGRWVIVARGLNNLVRGEYYRPDGVEARALLARLREATERAGFDLLASVYWDGLADLSEWEGDLGAALANMEEAIRLPRNRVRSAKGGWFGAHAAGLALEAGELDRAQSFMSAVDPEIGFESMWWCGVGLHIAARRRDLAETRRYAAALTAVAVGRGRVDWQLLHDVVRAMLLGGLAPGEVRAFLDGMPGGLGNPDRDQDPYRLLTVALLQEALGEIREALGSYQAAMANAGTCVRPAALGTAHVGAGRCLVALGRLDKAKEHVTTAAGLLERWAGSRVEELAALERRLGGGIFVEGPAELTSREREVAALLADGLTNGELGTRLFISPKTASVHVSNILAKLGMTSRAEIAAYAVRSGLAAG